MKGLEEILQKIEQDSNIEAENIRREAEKNAEKIIADTVEKANARAQKIIAQADKKTSVMLENAKNGCEALIKRSEISTKAEIVGDCIRKAAESLSSMETAEYFEVLKKLILKYCHPNEQGELLMSEKDILGMPKHFLKEIKKEGADIELCKIPVDINGGFVIRYGGVEENCTFDTLIEEKTDEIKDKLYSLLQEV